MVFPRQGVIDLPSRLNNDDLQKGQQEKIESLDRPAKDKKKPLIISHFIVKLFISYSKDGGAGPSAKEA